MFATFLEDLHDAHLSQGPGPEQLVTEADLALLPATAARFLRFMGVVGRPRDWSFRVRSVGRFRVRRDFAWMSCECWQYDSGVAPARVFHMSLRTGGLLPLLVRDSYQEGRGRLLAQVLGRFPVVDDSGPGLDREGLLGYLVDALLLAPSSLLAARTTWRALDDRSFQVTLTDGGCGVTATVSTDGKGAITTVRVEGRSVASLDDPLAPARQAPWTLAVAGWCLYDGRRLPTGTRATWHLPEGDFDYAELRVLGGELELNVPPKAPAAVQSDRAPALRLSR
jgi:hypothetical protein